MGDRRQRLKEFAQETLKAIANGSYILQGTTYDLRTPTEHSKRHTTYHPPDGHLASWASDRPTAASDHTTPSIVILEVSTLQGARYLHDRLLAQGAAPPDAAAAAPTVGILNFASARKPGGGFLSGAQAQEESLARASTLHPTLTTRTAQAFYTLHNRDAKGGYYTHAMVHSPRVTVFRDDAGAWVPPYAVDVVTSAAVNAGAVRQTLFGRVAGAAGVERRIEAPMRERMARVLYLFERQGTKHVVLGSFGTGVFKNSVETVAAIWADLLLGEDARFGNSFESVVFAILGRETFDVFRDVFGSRGLDC